MISSNIKDWIVLIVDDEPDNLNVAQKVLTYNGAQVFVARNGTEGLQVLGRVKPTFILLDLSMPEMDGWEMFRRARSNPNLNDVPIIALTAHAMSGDRERVMETGFNGYISKPFLIDSFLLDIQVCLENFAAL